MFRYAILFNNNVKTEIHIKRPVIEEESIIEKNIHINFISVTNIAFYCAKTFPKFRFFFYGNLKLMNDSIYIKLSKTQTNPQ